MKIQLSSHRREALVLAIVAIIINIGLMLLPSIVLGVPSLVLNDWRLAIFVLLVSLWIILEAVASSKQHHVNHGQTSTQWLPTLMSAAMLFVFLASLTEQALIGVSPFTIPSIIGCVAIVTGMILRFRAIRRLGCYFLDDVIIVDGQSLVTTGIYQHMRHPSEAGNLCIALGSSLLLGSLIGLLSCLVLVLPIVRTRIRLEDNLLLEHYPDSFASYVHDVPALFPKQVFRL